MIPNVFYKASIPDFLPEGMQRTVEKLEKSKNEEDCLKKAYDALFERYVGCKVHTRFFDIFTSDVNKLWDVKYQHCTALNYFLRILLVKSGFFKDEDITLKWTLIYYISIHQYLRIRLDGNRAINVDPWGAHHNIKFGDYAHGFHY